MRQNISNSVSQLHPLMLESDEIISALIPSSEEETGMSRQVHVSQTKRASLLVLSDNKDDQRSFSVSALGSLIIFVQRSLVDYILWASSSWGFF